MKFICTQFPGLLFAPIALIFIYGIKEKLQKNDNSTTSSIKQWEHIKMETERACRVKVKIYLKSKVIENVMDNYLHVCAFQIFIDTYSITLL